MPKKDSEKQKKVAKPKADPKVTKLKKFIITTFVKKISSALWPREMKIAARLVELYPDEKFWESFRLGFELNSLAWFKLPDGEKLLERKFGEFKCELTKPKVYNISEEPDEIKINAKKPRTINEFLKSHAK